MKVYCNANQPITNEVITNLCYVPNVTAKVKPFIHEAHTYIHIYKNQHRSEEPRTTEAVATRCVSAESLVISSVLSFNLHFIFPNRISLLLTRSCYPIVLTMLSGSRSYILKNSGNSLESNPGPLGWQSNILTTIPQSWRYMYILYYKHGMKSSLSNSQKNKILNEVSFNTRGTHYDLVQKITGEVHSRIPMTAHLSLFLKFNHSQYFSLLCRISQMKAFFILKNVSLDVNIQTMKKGNSSN